MILPSYLDVPRAGRWAHLTLTWAMLGSLFALPVDAQLTRTEPGEMVPYANAEGLRARSLQPASRINALPSDRLFPHANEFARIASVSSGRHSAIPDWEYQSAESSSASSGSWGVAVGGVIGLAATYFALNSGVDSTQLCNQTANQDAIETRYCFGLYVLGGVAGAVVGWMVHEWITDDP